jgi:hypothetical protein
MTRGSGIVDDISRHVAGCATCKREAPNMQEDRPPITTCAVYRHLYQKWKAWLLEPDWP